MSVAAHSGAAAAAQAAPERTQGQQAQASLAAARARVAVLEQQVATMASSALRYHIQLISFVQNLQAGLALVDHEGQIQFVNQRFWALFGLPPVPGSADGGRPIAHGRAPRGRRRRPTTSSTSGLPWWCWSPGVCWCKP
ncbi:MAG: PAS domain-containing protein [Bacteroidota bacterium]|nr:PAS domain-containing protein [Bacteroidota bacterium]